MPSRLAALAALAVIVPLAPTLAEAAPPAAAPRVTAAAAPAETAGPYQATIRRTTHGIPHVTADDWGSLGFGSGYVAAEDSTCTLADTLVTARAQRSRWFGPDGLWDDRTTPSAPNLQVDAFVTDLRNREVVEGLLADPKAGPTARARKLVRGYTAGINAYLTEVGADGVTDPACAGAGYLVPDVKPIDLWYGVYLANLIASSGRFVKEIVGAEPPAAGRGQAARPQLREIDADAVRRALGRDPETAFGSNATAIGRQASTTRRGMVLGNPHFPWTGRYRFTQQHLTIPGRYDVAGASLIGSPAINIGWNADVAWSHTVSTAFRFTPYEFPTPAPGTYQSSSGPRPIERREVEVTVLLEDGSLGTATEDLYRTEVGYVFHSPATLMPWSTKSVWAIRDANGEHLRTIDTFLDMGRASDVRDLLRRQDAGGGMPWVNTTAADRAGRVLYADHSVVPNVPDAMAQRCMTDTGRLVNLVAGLPGLDGTRSQGACAWRTDADAQRPGVFGPANLPAVVRRDWVMNANDSYWTPNDRVRLEGYAGIIGCEQCGRTMRTRMVARYVMDRLAGGQRETPATLRGHQHENRVMAAEVMRAGGALDAVCDATGETEACAVLAAWDGRSDADSVGAHLFEEFLSRLPSTGVWLTPFDPKRPLATPRGLDAANPKVVQAMTDAIAWLRERDIAPDAAWGTLQLPGDRGAPPFPLGGGSGSVGNANALTSRWVDTGEGWHREVLAGSSHIQAISFRSGGRLDARTILTYGQREDPTSPWSQDQTELFSQERWVRFPWTEAQIDDALVEEYVVGGD